MWDAIKDFKPKQHESVGWAWNTNVGKWYGVKEVYHSFFEEEGIDKEDFYQQLWKLKILKRLKISFGGCLMIGYKSWKTC